MMNKRSSSHAVACAAPADVAPIDAHDHAKVITSRGWPGMATSPIMLALVAAWFLAVSVSAVPLPGLH